LRGTGQARVQRRDRLLAGASAVGVHVIVLAAALFWPHARPSPPKPPLSSIVVSVAEVPTPEPPGPPNADVAPGAPDKVVRLTPPHLAPASEPAPAPVPDNSDLLSESQIAGAASAGEEGAGGGGGGGCDMARLVQQALRRDSLVRTAVEDANRLGKATMLWNGDWVRSGIQDGKGLSAVRQAIMWEVGFAPQACRNQRMHGLVLLSLADGGTRFAIGSGDWRWSDLLGVGGSVRGLPPDR
jgi:hypothetical protein